MENYNMSMFTYLVLCAVAISLSSVNAEGDELGYNEEMNILNDECLKQFDLTNEHINDVVKTGDLSTINSCYWGCYFQKIGILNAKGQYDLDNYLITRKKFWKDDDFSFLAELGRRCASVKDAAVKDGEAGCETGALLAACFTRIIRNEYGLELPSF